MSAFTRIKNIIASNLNTLLDKAEDPGKMIDLSIRKLEDAASSMRKALKEKMDEKAKVEGRLTEARAAIARWQERARAAAARGMDDLAREAIAARRELERKADKDEQLSTTLADVIASLQATLERTEKKLEELIDKSDSLKARADGAKVRAKADKAEGTDWERKIAEMEERIRGWEAMADMDSHRPDRSFEDMERDEEIEKELERLKKEASHGTSDRVL